MVDNKEEIFRLRESLHPFAATRIAHHLNVEAYDNLEEGPRITWPEHAFIFAADIVRNLGTITLALLGFAQGRWELILSSALVYLGIGILNFKLVEDLNLARINKK